MKRLFVNAENKHMTSFPGMFPRVGGHRGYFPEGPPQRPPAMFGDKEVRHNSRHVTGRCWGLYLYIYIYWYVVPFINRRIKPQDWSVVNKNSYTEHALLERGPDLMIKICIILLFLIEVLDVVKN